MNTLDYFVKEFGIDLNLPSPIPIMNKSRFDLGTSYPELGFTSGAEIGVEKGAYSYHLCRNNPHLKLYSVDPWLSYKGYREFISQEKQDDLYRIAKKMLRGCNCEIIRGFSMDAVKRFNDESLDFVYIDGNHEIQNALNDICEWSKKVKSGGVVSGHDYSPKIGHHPTDECDVYDLLNIYTKAKRISPWFYMSDGAWFWIKE